MRVKPRYWQNAWRIAVVTLLGIIVLQLGGWEFISDTARGAAIALRDANKTTEEPAPLRPGQQSHGFDALFEAETMDVIRRSIIESESQASAPKR